MDALGGKKAWNDTHAQQVQLLAVPDAEYETKLAAAIAAGTPPDIMLRLQENIAAAFGDDGTKAQLKQMGLTPVANTPSDFARELEQERDIT